MTKLAIVAAIAFAVSRAAFAQNATEPGVPAGLSDLEKTTFACPKAALNAAAREVAMHPSKGTYQFSYFNIVSSSHHAAFEVHFTSNYAAEPVLKFCVALYCQQGFDPATTKASVTLMDGKAGTHAAAGHPANACTPPRTAAKRGTTR